MAMRKVSAHLFSLLLTGLFGILLIASSQAQASGQIYINVGQAKVKKSLIALPPFQFYGSQNKKRQIQTGQTLYNVIFNDLNVSSLFVFIKPAAYLEDPSKVGLKPAPGEKNGFHFSNWKTIGAEFLIRIGYRINVGKIKMESYVYYVPQAKTVLAKTYEASTTDVRLLAHTFADDVVKALTGKKSIFQTKIVVSSTRGAAPGGKEIWIMDWDGANAHRITHYKSIAISPAWSFDNKKIAYTAYAYHRKAHTRNADLFIYDVKSKKTQLVSYRRGINSGACFLPEGHHLLLTISAKGNPDIYKMTLNGKHITPITHGPAGAMNVEPAVTKDGKTIAFSSTRGGRPMIYVMNSDGSHIRRRTFAGQYNSTPSWSPDGKKIAFAGFDKTHFDIFIMNKDGSDLKRLTDATKPDGKKANNEDPTFSPDGRHIMFVSDRTGKNQLYVVDPDGTNERRITFDRYQYYKPKWSHFTSD